LQRTFSVGGREMFVFLKANGKTTAGPAVVFVAIV
jgi:hypothetical protein